MSIYYVAKLFQDDPRISPDYLGPRRDGPRQSPESPLPLGVVGVEAAKRFLWKEEAIDALRQFMHDHGGGRIVSGQVFHVHEDPVGPVIRAGEAPPAPPEPPSEPPEPVLIQTTPKLDIETGEALVAEYEAFEEQEDPRPKRVQEARFEAGEWFLLNASTIFALLRERDRLNWLRMNPEGCRAAKDCRNPRKEGYILCEECVEDPNSGGYFDVYRNYYVQVYNDELEKLLGRFVIQPEGSDHPPGPEAPQAPPTCPA